MKLPGLPVKHLVLPDFCTPRALLLLLTIVTLTALLLALADAGLGPQFRASLASKLMFLVWIGLFGAALLCALRPRIAARGALAGAALASAAIAALVLVLSEIAFRVLASPALNPYGVLGQPPAGHLLFLVRNLAIGLLVCAAALRYAYVAQQWRLQVEGEARARIEALQARIRPHFLYNSMNTIAALTRSDPSGAENAVLDLADLFRASLDERRGLIPLADELETARTYQRIEQLRLGARLRVRWDLDDLPPHILVPALTLQPLLENAIGHGVENLPEGGEVTIQGTLADGLLLLAVRNPLPLDSPATAGTGRGLGLALDNIRERLALLYGARAGISAGREGDEFTVRLRLPVIAANPESPP
ncbi:MAG TPA: sensor histidine kinase [Steroidobacteraceae bacterium]|nr:sensor histidine kinase [Steroidobacteraceae bacterium]